MENERKRFFDETGRELIRAGDALKMLNINTAALQVTEKYAPGIYYLDSVKHTQVHLLTARFAMTAGGADMVEAYCKQHDIKYTRYEPARRGKQIKENRDA